MCCIEHAGRAAYKSVRQRYFSGGQAPSPVFLELTHGSKNTTFLGVGRGSSAKTAAGILQRRVKIPGRTKFLNRGSAMNPSSDFLKRLNKSVKKMHVKQLQGLAA